MGDRIADSSRCVHDRLRGVCDARTGRAARRKRAGLDVWRNWIRFHAFRGAAGRTKTGSDMADWTSAGVDARAPMARLAELAHDFVSRRISFWRDVDARSDVAADYYGSQRSVWRGAATLRAASDDHGCEAGDDLRRNRQRAKAAAGRGGSQRRSDLRAAGDWQIGERGSAARGRLQRGADNGDKQRRRGSRGGDGGAKRRRMRAFAKILFERDASVPGAAKDARITPERCGQSAWSVCRVADTDA